MADGNKPAMDQNYYLTDRTTTAIHKSIDLLNDEDLFDSSNDGDYLVEEEEEVFGDNGDTEDEGEVEVVDSDDEIEEEDDEE